MIGDKVMRKSIVILVGLVLVFAAIVTFSSVVASTGGDENYNDHSYEQAEGNQPDADDIPGMSRAEDRTRNKDL